MAIKKLAKLLINKTGYKLTRLTGNNFIDNDNPFEGVKSLMTEMNKKGIFFDIGANIGQTVIDFKTHFPECKIFSFEPGEEAYQKLRSNFGGKSKIQLENIALGSKEEEKPFNQNSESVMSSFLPLGQNGWGEIKKTSSVKVSTIDKYCKDNQIDHINFLKSDTQGYEMEVLKGASGMLKDGKIQFIYLEINFIELYKGQPSFCDIFQYLTSFGYRFMKLYDFHYFQSGISWVDGLFYYPDFNNNLELQSKSLPDKKNEMALQ